MKVIGLLGGMSWESSLEYYRIINRIVREKLGGLHSAECILDSVDFQGIEKLQHAGDWEELERIMIIHARRLEQAGADVLLVCSNTMHLLADRIQEKLGIPLLHIADATAVEIKADGIVRVGLLGTKFTMNEPFYRGRLEEKFGLEVLVPGEDEQESVHGIIYNELCLGRIEDSSREFFKTVIEGLVRRGAEGIVLGCTEIPLLVRREDSPVPLFDTTNIHAKAAVEFATARAQTRGA
ncbi:MAG TPA: aspartate/glutamate racemase family protein [Spirochaetia bacterium]|nr:aspartate/glutamate racemase family protein [Spirochaetia bacterium]